MLRASSLDAAEICGAVTGLRAAHPRTYRNTLMGTAAHALWGEEPARGREALGRLTPEERETVLSWRRPDNWHDEETGAVLTYARADKEEVVGLSTRGGEFSVSLDGHGNYIDHSDLLVPARPDMWWLDEHLDLEYTVYVADIKTGEMPIAGGPLSLQFVAPALALCEGLQARRFRTGIWYARRGVWEWGPLVAADSDLAIELFQRIRTAATNPPTPVIGAHCGECFERQHCPAFAVPASQATDEMEVLREGALAAATPAQLLKAHLSVQAMTKLLEVAKDTLKAEFRERERIGAPVVLDDGAILGLRTSAGREYADLAMLKADGLTKYIKRSRPSEQIAVRKAEAK